MSDHDAADLILLVFSLALASIVVAAVIWLAR